MIMQLKSVILEQRMGNERSFMQLCGVIGDLIVVPFRSEVMVKSRSYLAQFRDIRAFVHRKPLFPIPTPYFDRNFRVFPLQ